MPRSTHIYGPAYLDRVLRIDRPLLDLKTAAPLDRSVDGRLEPGEGLTIADAAGGRILVEAPANWPGPWGIVRLEDSLANAKGAWHRRVLGLDWHDDLGGMGAGYAAAFGGTLVSALGRSDDPHTQSIVSLIARAGIVHQPLHVHGARSDWTLLLTSAEYGDKLPIGFRGCHASLKDLGVIEPCDLRVVASLPNRLCAEALSAPGARVRFFAPTMRNMLDTACPLRRFAHHIDILSCNQGEWSALRDRDLVEACISIVVVTGGASGSRVRFLSTGGRRDEVFEPAFPRARPPQDTNRAGEAYSSTFVSTLLGHGWAGGAANPEMIRACALRASAAAALILDRRRFGFPDPAEITESIELGIV